MKKWHRVVIGLFVFISALLLCGFLLIVLSPQGMCSNTMYIEYPSPDKKLTAVVFERSCGATTGFTTQISIVNSSSKLKNKSGNIFISRAHPDQVSPRLNWLSDTHLVIKRNMKNAESLAELEWSGPEKVSISYE